MADAGTTDAAKTPIWFWILAVLATIWNFGGVFDYVMTQLGVDWYLAGFTEAQLAYFTGFPAWYVAIWASAVHLAFIASLAMFLRTRLTAPLFLAALVLFVINAIYLYGFTPAMAMMGTGGLIFSAIIFLSLVGLWQVCRFGVRQGFLR
jgi:hypothetical protein